MKLSLEAFRSRVAQRVLLLFVLCALVPVTVLAAVSYTHVRSQLERQSRARLAEVSKNAGMAVMERLLFLEGKLAVLASTVRERDGALQVEGDGRALEGFAAVTLAPDDGAPRRLVGDLDPANVGASTFVGPGPGETRLRIRDAGGGRAEVLMVRRLVGVPATLWTRLDHQFLWSTALAYANLPSTAGVCVVTEGLPPLLCTVPDPDGFRRLLATGETGRVDREVLTWTDPGGDQHLVGRWSLFLEPGFDAPTLHLGVTESRSAVLAPMENFEQTFLAVVGLALLAVGFLGHRQIQERLEPVTEIRDATNRIARREFGVRLNLESGDEFEELASSFNVMARRLGSQFHALSTIGDIDRAILSALDTESIARTVVTRIGDVVPGERSAVCVLDREGGRTATLYWRHEDGDEVSVTREVEVGEEDVLLMNRGRLRVLRRGRDELPGLVRRIHAEPGEVAEAVVAPIQLDGSAAGALLLTHHLPVEYEEDDLERLRQIADQMAVAQKNARLLDDLEKVNRGAFTALARTIDAKSPWTAGHSERVAGFAVEIGRALDLDEDGLATLRRGGLLHDIGKLGIPATVLDKAGNLEPEERSLIETHVTVGARILEPVPALSDTVPIVRWHHERWDGDGYPDGLSGEEIPLLARVIAVADCFDALTSNRPYRPGLRPDEARRFIHQSAGAAFDPRVTEAFIRAPVALAKSPRPGGDGPSLARGAP